MDNRPIGVFDSGVGGLSILSEIKKLLPKENFIFVADQKSVPYGEKKEKQLQDLASKICLFLISKKVKAIIIACNTATIYTIDHLRSQFKIPIIGTVPVVKTIADISKTKKTAVFSTHATSKSKYLRNLITRFGNGAKIYIVDAAGLADLIEDVGSKDGEIDEMLKKYLNPLIKKGVDAIALGCTHYPFLRDKIRKIVGKNVKIVDSGGAVARRTKAILTNNKILGSKREEDFYYTTGDPVKFKKVAETLLKKKLENVDYLEL